VGPVLPVGLPVGEPVSVGCPALVGVSEVDWPVVGEPGAGASVTGASDVGGATSEAAGAVVGLSCASAEGVTARLIQGAREHGARESAQRLLQDGLPWKNARWLPPRPLILPEESGPEETFRPVIKSTVKRGNETPPTCR